MMIITWLHLTSSVSPVGEVDWGTTLGAQSQHKRTQVYFMSTSSI